MPWPLEVKARIIAAAVYTNAFYGSELVAIGIDKLNSFRRKLVTALIGESNRSMNPALYLNLADEKLLDPHVVVILKAVKEARRFLWQAEQHDKESFLHIASCPGKHQGKSNGPASALREYLSRIGWQLDRFGKFVGACENDLHLLQDSF